MYTYFIVRVNRLVLISQLLVECLHPRLLLQLLILIQIILLPFASFPTGLGGRTAHLLKGKKKKKKKNS